MRKRRLVPAGLAGTGAAALTWAVGLDAGHVVALALVTTAAVAVVGLLPVPKPLVWPEEEPSTSGAGWHQVALLAGYLGQVDHDPGRASAVVRRLRELATGRLGRAGVPWDSPAARTALGPELYDVLDGRRPPRRATRLMAETLARVEAAEVARSHDHR